VGHDAKNIMMQEVWAVGFRGELLQPVTFFAKQAFSAMGK
jgi:hypothetical protein